MGCGAFVDRKIVSSSRRTNGLSCSSFYVALILASFILVKPIYSQGDSTEQEILRYHDTDNEIIGKSRTMILNYLKEDKLDQAIKIKSYLESKYSGKKVVALWEKESCFLDIVTGDYKSALKISSYSDTISYAGYLFPQRDLFFDELGKIAALKKDSIIEKLQTGNLPSPDSRFLQLTFKYLMSQACGTYYDEQLNINQLCTQYIQDFPYSSYNDFIKNYLRYAYKPSNFTWGFGLNSGYVGIQGNLSNYILPSLMLGISANFIYKGFTSEIYMDFCLLSKVKQQFEKSGIWTEGMSLENFKGELIFSYPALNYQSIDLSPFAGFGVFELTPSGKKDDNNKNMDIDIFTFNAGIALSYYPESEKGADINPNGVGVYSFLKFHLGYSKLITTDTRFKGDLFYLMVTYNWNMLSIVRDL